MGFFNDLGSLLGEAADIKSELENVLGDVQGPISEATGEFGALSDDVSTAVQETIQEAADNLGLQK